MCISGHSTCHQRVSVGTPVLQLSEEKHSDGQQRVQRVKSMSGLLTVCPAHNHGQLSCSVQVRSHYPVSMIIHFSLGNAYCDCTVLILPCCSSPVFILQCNMEHINQLLSRYAVNTIWCQKVYCFENNWLPTLCLWCFDSKKESHLLKGLVRSLH